MKNWIYGIWSKFLDWFGKIKVMTFGGLPVLATARPYYVTGYSIVELMKMLKPGDVLIRGYDDYLDGKFIPDKLGYSHAGLYVGKNEVVHSASPCV
jgi:cell wall-associated NlpC family hydrolase